MKRGVWKVSRVLTATPSPDNSDPSPLWRATAVTMRIGHGKGWLKDECIALESSTIILAQAYSEPQLSGDVFDRSTFLPQVFA